MKKKFYFFRTLFVLTLAAFILSTACKKEEEPEIPTDPNLANVKDADNNEYTVTKIGDQYWMKENLKTTKHNDGTAIPEVTADNAWFALSTPGHCWYDNNKAANLKLGALYNWHAVNSNKLCPTGWKVPTDADWNKLFTSLGGLEVAGGKMKETGTANWKAPNTGATNSSGFTAVPSGFRMEGYFQNKGDFSNMWSSSELDATTANYINLGFQIENVFIEFSNKTRGFSVRCLKK